MVFLHEEIFYVFSGSSRTADTRSRSSDILIVQWKGPKKKKRIGNLIINEQNLPQILIGWDINVCMKINYPQF